MDRDRKVIGWPLLAVIVLVILIVFVRLISASRANVQDMQARQDALAAQVSTLESLHAQLAAELEHVGTDGYVENEAREKYDFIMEGEIRFEFVNPEMLEKYTPEEWQIIMEERRLQ